jgi:hypothetical protein
MFPLQFRHPGPPFLTLLCPAGHPENSLQFWSVSRLVGWSVGRLVDRSQGTHMNFSFITWARPSQPFYALWATPKTALNFGWLVGWSISRSVGRTWGSHTNVMLPLQFRHPGPPFPTHLHPAGHPKTALNFGRLVSWSVTGKSHECHAAYSVSSPGPALPNPSTPCAPPQNDLKFWSSGQSVSRSIGRSRGSHTNDMLPL